MGIILMAQNINKIFGEGATQNHVLSDVDLTVNAGDFVSIMGPSGCGKSTLLYILGGLDKPTSGTVALNGEEIYKINDTRLSRIRRTDIGFVFQFYNLVQNLSVEDNILLPIVMSGKKASSCKNKLDEILELVGLQDKRREMPGRLSGGQQQRVSIARAVITSPKIIFADEPIGNLDSKSGKAVMKLFKSINREKKITILQVTHSESSALYGNRIITLSDGRIIKDEAVNQAAKA